MGRTDELGAATGELSNAGVATGELSESGVGMSEWGPAPMKQQSKHRNMTDVGERKAGWLEITAAAVDTRYCESCVSDCSKVSHPEV